MDDNGKGCVLMKNLTSTDEFDLLMKSREPLLVFKHSTTCPISAAAYEQVHAFEGKSPVPIYLLKVIEDRTASNYVAEVTGIKHESPQAILFKEGKPVFSVTHWKITENALLEALE